MMIEIKKDSRFNSTERFTVKSVMDGEGRSTMQSVGRKDEAI